MCLSATKCKPAPTPHALTVQAQPAQQRRKTTQSATAHTQQSHTQAQLPQLAVSPHTHNPHSAVPRYGLLGPASPKAFIRPHRPHSLTPTATAAAKQAKAAAHHHATTTSNSQQHPQIVPQMPPIPTVLAEPLQAEAEASTEQQHPQPPSHRRQASPTDQTTMASQTRHQTPPAHQSTLCPTQQEGQNQTRHPDHPTAPPPRSLLEHHRIAGSS